ncbi:MAG: glycosyltransferase family 2 protein [Sphingomonas sp.]
MQHGLSATALLRAYLAVARGRPLRALAIAWWWVTRRKLRARNHLSAAIASLPHHYQIWLSLYQPGSAGIHAASLPQRGAGTALVLAIHLHIRDRQIGAILPALPTILEQLTEQDALFISSSLPLTGGVPSVTSKGGHVHILPHCVESRAEAIRQVLDATEASYLVPLDAEATLSPGAVEVFARAIAGDPEHRTIFYADQDERDCQFVRHNPWLKPEWDEDLFLAQDYISGACAIPADAARSVVGQVASEDAVVIYEIIARLVLTPSPLPVHRVPFVAITADTGMWCRDSPVRADLVRRLLAERTATPAMQPLVEPAEFGTVSVRWPLPNPPPMVSVIVPTRDRLDLLEVCVAGVLECTDYPNIELIIADNESVEPETMAFFERWNGDPRVKVVRWPHPYNYSAINNFAVAQASGQYLCLLNNDTEVIDPSWLREMMAHAVRPQVGAVGARLLYPDRSIQHAGVVMGMGGAAGHAHRGLPEGEPGYFAQALVARGATAVTAACLVVAREKFAAVGGLDEKKLAIAYNDVDLCLKLRAAGWRNIYVPQAMLIHHEGKSRGLDFAPEHLARYLRELAEFQQRWGAAAFRDPMHHPALDLASETYRLKV